MPPRRRHLHARSASVPCRNGRQMKDRRRRRRRRADHNLNGTTSLPDDALASIFARSTDTAAVVRCAATCREWGRVVAARAASISRSLPPLGRFIPGLTVGVFHQENDRPNARAGNTSSSSWVQPCFVPTASGGRFLGCHRSCTIGSLFGLRHDARFLDYSRPVASRNGRLVLELRLEGRAVGGFKLAVCNPMARDVVMVPPLSDKDKFGDYGCALLTSDDLRFHHPPRCSHNFFRLLLVYNRRGCTMLRCYSSDIGKWGPESKSDVRIPSLKLRDIGQAVVHRGVAFWALDHGVLGVRLDAAQDVEPATATDMHLVPYGHLPHYWPEKRLLGVSADNRLFFAYFSIWQKEGAFNLRANLSYFEFSGDDIRTGRKEPYDRVEGVVMHEMRLPHYDKSLKLRWFGEKSGIILFTLAESSGLAGTYALSLREQVVEKVADGRDGDSWRSMVGYEMDMAAYLASVAP